MWKLSRKNQSNNYNLKDKNLNWSKKKCSLKLKKLRFEQEMNHSVGAGRKIKQVEEACLVFKAATSPNLSHFVNRKDNLDNYLL